MAKKKAELEQEFHDYHSKLERMNHAHSERQYLQALQRVEEAWDFVDGMMQFERRYLEQTERKDLQCVNYALRYAPLLFATNVLDSLSIMLQTQKRIDKYTSADLASDLANAQQKMREAHRMWDFIESHEVVEQDQLRSSLGGNQDTWRWFAEQWEAMGLIRRQPKGNSYTLDLITRMEATVRAKCSRCGVVAKAAKGRFWEATTCPKCSVTNYFVILVEDGQ